MRDGAPTAAPAILLLAAALVMTSLSLRARPSSRDGTAGPVQTEPVPPLPGKDIDDVRAWKKWWDGNKETWKSTVPGENRPKDLNASDTFTDDAYGFEIRKPNRAWFFLQAAENAPWMSLEALEEGQRAAWVEMYVKSTRACMQKTPELMARAIRKDLEGKFRVFESAEWERRCVYGGMMGVEQVLLGQHRDFDAVRMRNVFLEKDGVMYFFHCVCRSGRKASLESDVEQILRSFRWTR